MGKTLIKWLLFILLFAAPVYAQVMVSSFVNSPVQTIVGMTKDATVTPCSANTSSSVTSINCSLGTVPAGDTIICSSEYGDSGPSAKISDSINGVYNMASYGVTGSGGYHEFLGTWYFPNTASGSTTVTESFSISVDASGFSCAAFKNGRTTSVLDSTVFGWNDNGTASTSATLPASQTPANNGSLIYCTLSTGSNSDSATSASGSYTIVGGDSTDALYPMYSAQTTKTSANCPYTVSPSDSWTIMGNAFLVSTASAGITPYQGFIETFSGLTNGSVPSSEPLAAGVSGNVPGWFGNEVDWFQNGFFTIINANTDLTGSTSGPTSTLSSTLYLPAQNPVTGCCSFTAYQTYTGNSSLNLQLATGSSGDGIKLTILPTQTTLSWGYYIQWNIPNTDSNGHTYTLGGAAMTSDQLYIQLQPNGTTMTMNMVGKSAALASLGTVSSGTAYWVTEQFNEGGTDSGAVYSGCPSSCTLVGSNTLSDSGNTNPITSFFIGSTSGTQASGDDIWWRNVKFCPSNTYPCLP